MPVIEIANKQVTVNEEGFLTVYDEWNEEIAKVLAQQIDVEMTEAHWNIIKFLREDFKTQGETATSRRVQTVGGVPVKEQFALFPKKPAKKMAYIAGLPKPKGCVTKDQTWIGHIEISFGTDDRKLATGILRIKLWND